MYIYVNVSVGSYRYHCLTEISVVYATIYSCDNNFLYVIN